MTTLTQTINNQGSLIAGKLTSFKFLNTRTLRVLCQLALVILLARELATMTWQLIPDSAGLDSGSPASRVLPPSQSSSKQENPLAPLGALQLFGQPPVVREVNTPVPEAVPVSRLAVQVTGLVASTNTQGSLAIIRSGSTDTTYRPGDTLAGTRAKVESIYADRVIIRNGERYESLLMYPDEVRRKSSEMMVKTGSPNKKAVANLREKLQENPSSWSDIVNISPIRENGELLGYRINPAKYPKQFTQLGLKPNDIAIAINGYDLTNTGEALKVMSQLTKQNPKTSLDQVSLTIERDGQRFDVDLSS